MEQTAFTFTTPKKKRRAKDPFVTDAERGIYFWCATHGTGATGYETVNFSTSPHELLPHWCEEHAWYSDRPCVAEHNKGFRYAGEEPEEKRERRRELHRAAEKRVA